MTLQAKNSNRIILPDAATVRGSSLRCAHRQLINKPISYKSKALKRINVNDLSLWAAVIEIPLVGDRGARQKMGVAPLAFNFCQRLVGTLTALFKNYIHSVTRFRTNSKLLVQIESNTPHCQISAKFWQISASRFEWSIL